MTIEEVFPNPTVKNVIFQIMYPNMFYLESKMGDLQMELMRDFPESDLKYQRQFIIANLGPEMKVDFKTDQEENVKKIWEFKSRDKCVLNIAADSLGISSEYHKTYNLDGAPKFRDVIEQVLKAFLGKVHLPVINRIGLRYIDECPVPAKNNEAFESYYNSAFPLSRFAISEADEMAFRTVVAKDEYRLCYMETLRVQDGKPSLILDFDGFALNIESAKCLETVDRLHEIISKEYESSIKAPVYEHMRKREDAAL
jgi:uncharacterized protein (TIGR04255 family)